MAGASTREQGKEAERLAARYTERYVDLKGQLLAKYASGGRLVGSEPLYRNKDTDSRLLECPTHPLRAYVSAPRLSEDLVGYLDKQ